MLRALKVCLKPGCNELTRDGYCEQHKQQAMQQMNSKYDRYNRNQKAKEFYRSKEWFKARSHRLKQDYYLCVKCQAEGRLTKADVVHHKVELLSDWDKRAENENLESLCHACHNALHKSRNKG